MQSHNYNIQDNVAYSQPENKEDMKLTEVELTEVNTQMDILVPTACDLSINVEDSDFFKIT